MKPNKEKVETASSSPTHAQLQRFSVAFHAPLQGEKIVGSQMDGGRLDFLQARGSHRSVIQGFPHRVHYRFNHKSVIY
jgi:hypothetical protein